MSRVVHSSTHVAYVTTHRALEVAIVEVFEKVWPKDLEKKANHYTLGSSVSCYETAIKGAKDSAVRELTRLQNK